MDIHYRRGREGGYYEEKSASDKTEVDNTIIHQPDGETGEKSENVQEQIGKESEAPAKISAPIPSQTGENIKEIRLVCQNSTKKKIQRTFGSEIFCKIKGEDNFIVTVEVVVDKAFFGWLTSMGRNVHILKPKKAAVAYRDYLKNIAKIIRELINKYDIRKDRIMKRRATAILLGIMVSSMFLSACGKNEAKEAANESAQVEEEGVGEVTEEGEKVEAENKNASDADDSSKAGDSAKSDEDNKETSVKEEEDGDSSGKDSDDESEEDVEVTEASAGKIGVLLSDDDEDAKIDSEEMTSQIEDGGYEADVKNAGGDPALQISQIQEFIDEQVSALIIDPVDSYGLTDILKTAKEQEYRLFPMTV